MAIDPAERPPSAAALLERLDALSPDGPAPVPPRPVRPLAEAVRLPPALAGGRQAAVRRAHERARRAARHLAPRASPASPGVVLVRGNAGIGKTRLCTQFAREVHADGGTVLYGRCEEEALAPYGPFVEALRHFAAHQPDLPEQLAACPAGFELARLGWPVPGAAPQAPPAPGSDRAAGRYQLFEAAVDARRRDGGPGAAARDLRRRALGRRADAAAAAPPRPLRRRRPGDARLHAARRRAASTTSAAAAALEEIRREPVAAHARPRGARARPRRPSSSSPAARRPRPATS